MNTESRTRILLIEDNPDHALIVSRALEQRAPGRYAVVHVERLQEGLWNGTEDVAPAGQDKLLVIRRPQMEGASLPP